MKDSSKSWQGSEKHIGNSFIIVVLLLVALVAFAVAVMFLEGVASYLRELLGRIEKYKVLQTIGFCIAGVLLVWQAWATNKRAKLTEKNAKSAAAGQQEERLKNAIEHLGHERAAVRISGAYEFFHLAKGAKDKGLKSLPQNVLKILCAHIRHTTTGQTTTDQTATNQTATGQTTGEYNYQKEHETKPSEEIQGLLTLLFVQKHDDHDVFENCFINLQGSYLNGADLKHAQLQGADLSKAQLQGADLMNAQLQGADLSKAQLQGANLMNAQLQHAQLQGADLSKAQLQGTNLREAQLQGANLSNADSAPDSGKGKGD